MEDIYLIRKTVQHMAKLMEALVAQQGERRTHIRDVSLNVEAPKDGESPEGYPEDDLMTIKEAMAFIPVSRTKLYEMRKAGALRTVERNCRQKRLLRTQVEAARVWSRNKGKW